MAANQKTLYDERIATSTPDTENQNSTDDAPVSSTGKIILISIYLLSGIGLIIASLVIR